MPNRVWFGMDGTGSRNARELLGCACSCVVELSLEVKESIPIGSFSVVILPYAPFPWKCTIFRLRSR